MSEPIVNKANGYDLLIDRFMFPVFLVASIASLFLMMGLMCAGIKEIGEGIVGFFIRWGRPADMTVEGFALEHALGGTELLLLSPLAYFLLVSLASYAKTCRTPYIDHVARAKVVGVKALSTGLLIAIVATDLVRKILSQAGLGLRVACAECLVIVVLGVYFTVLEKLASTAEKSSDAVMSSGREREVVVH